jgi:hypothetical protein
MGMSPVFVWLFLVWFIAHRGAVKNRSEDKQVQ